MHLKVRTLDDSTWPGPFTPDDLREPTRFSASWNSTLSLLHREVDIAANGGGFHAAAVLEVPFPETRLYRDGSGVHADATHNRHPGVALSFDTETAGPLRFCADRFTYGGSGYLRDWQSNVRAIALGLEALRSVDRYGIVRKAEQYRGWQALGTGDAVPLGAGMTPRQAAEVLADAADYGSPLVLLDDPEAVAAAYRIAARTHHPDRGGSADAFASITTARDVLTSR